MRRFKVKMQTPHLKGVTETQRETQGMMRLLAERIAQDVFSNYCI